MGARGVECGPHAAVVAALEAPLDLDRGMVAGSRGFKVGDRPRVVGGLHGLRERDDQAASRGEPKPAIATDIVQPPAARSTLISVLRHEIGHAQY